MILPKNGGWAVIANSELQIRDPYVVTCTDNATYYLFGSTDPNIWGKGTGFDVYVGRDLEHWEGPFPAFRPNEAFWSDENYWAPEVYYFNGRFYMFATFKCKDNDVRGTAVLVADRVTGPYIDHSKGPVTPTSWQCLDGTLYVDEHGTPWMVFCHEWVQVCDGEVCAERLSPDLSCAEGEPVVLFRASEAPWTTPLEVRRQTEGDVYVTDGPFVYRGQTGTLFLLWASFTENRYALGIAKSLSGSITGPWEHHPEPLFQTDGGHGMLFTDLQGQLRLTLHQPNQTPDERPQFFDAKEVDGWIEIR